MSASGPFAALADAAASARPRVALILGSGLASFAERLKIVQTIPFLDVPGLPPASVAGHRGCVSLAEFGAQSVLVFEGRLHYYEGHPWRTVTLLVRIAAYLGARVLVLTNAAGGIRDDLDPGSLMAITDHIDWTQTCPWRVSRTRPTPYSQALLQLLQTAASKTGIDLRAGVYAAVTGPCYETPAEIRALRQCGADALGMSTAREIEAGVQAGMECCAMSCITNRAAGLSSGPITHDEVLAAAQARGNALADLLQAFVALQGKMDKH
jgi:purine-nucleoside phosphorylase